MDQNTQNDFVLGRSYDEISPSHDEEDVSTAIKASLNNTEGSSVLQRAILMSLNETKRSDVGSDQQHAPEASTTASCAGETAERETLESLIRNLSLNVARELPVVHDPVGDTWVFIDPPVQQPEQDEESYQRYSARYARPILMKKDVFMGLRSSYFEKLFGPTFQHRVVRRRGLVGKLPANVKYVIDLSPPTEGDQAAYLTTELWCPNGVRKWYQASRRWGVSHNMIGGQDEYMPPQKATAGASDEGGAAMLLEYSPVRHRAAIERVLLALQGSDPQLDSAPKVWTTFGVAKSFDITHSPLTDYFVRWLRAYPNTYFLEVLPEIALRIADGTECHNLCRDTFAILVGEEALGAIYRTRVSKADHSVNVHGRKMEHLPEAWKTRIEYASKAFSDRIMAEFTNLVENGMEWIDELPEFQKLSNLGPLPEGLEGDLTRLKGFLKAYVKGAVFTVLCTNFPDESTEGSNTSEDDLYPRKTWEEIWANLIPRERILTRSFWDVLRSCYPWGGPTNLHIRYWDQKDYMDIAGNAQKVKCEGLEFEFEEISAEVVERLIASINTSYLALRRELSEDCDSIDEGDGETGLTSTLTKDHGFIEEGHSNMGGSSSSAVPTQWWEGDAASEHASTENLLSRANEEDLGEESTPDSIDKENIPPEVSEMLEDKGPKTPPFFSSGIFHAQARAYIKKLCMGMLSPPDFAWRGAESLDVVLTRTLVCLEDPEWKYLPMWAGGNDDGSGGVFDDAVPVNDEGSFMEMSFGFGNRSSTSHLNTSLSNNKSFSDALSSNFVFVPRISAGMPPSPLMHGWNSPSGSWRVLDGGSSAETTRRSMSVIEMEEVLKLQGQNEPVQNEGVGNEQDQEGQKLIDDEMETDSIKEAQEGQGRSKTRKQEDVFDDIFTADLSEGEVNDDCDEGNDDSDMDIYMSDRDMDAVD